MKKETPRAKFIKEAAPKAIAAMTWDAMHMASTHDPDLVKAISETDHKLESWVKQLWREVDILKRQTERLGAPQYRMVRKGK